MSTSPASIVESSLSFKAVPRVSGPLHENASVSFFFFRFFFRGYSMIARERQASSICVLSTPLFGRHQDLFLIYIYIFCLLTGECLFFFAWGSNMRRSVTFPATNALALSDAPLSATLLWFSLVQAGCGILSAMLRIFVALLGWGAV